LGVLLTESLYAEGEKGRGKGGGKEGGGLSKRLRIGGKTSNVSFDHTVISRQKKKKKERKSEEEKRGKRDSYPSWKGGEENYYL